MTANTRRAEAEERMRRAKQLATRAARAVLDGLPLGPALADAANEEVEAARAELRALDAKRSASSNQSLGHGEVTEASGISGLTDKSERGDEPKHGDLQ